MTVMLLNELDIEGYFVTFNNELKIQVDGKWITLSPSGPTDELIDALKWDYGVDFVIEEGDVVEIRVNKFKNVDSDLLDALKDIRKEVGIKDED